MLAAEDFTTDDVNDVQLALNISRLNTSSALRLPDERYAKFQPNSYVRSCRFDRGRRRDAATCEAPSVLRSSLSSTRHRWWNPVAVLSDLRPNIQYRRGVDSDAQNDDRRPDDKTLRCRRQRSNPITITAVVDGQLFHGRGRTNKQAKRCLAADVLRTLFHFRFIGQKPGSPV